MKGLVAPKCAGDLEGTLKTHNSASLHSCGTWATCAKLVASSRRTKPLRVSWSRTVHQSWRRPPMVIGAEACGT